MKRNGTSFHFNCNRICDWSSPMHNGHAISMDWASSIWIWHYSLRQGRLRWNCLGTELNSLCDSLVSGDESIDELLFDVQKYLSGTDWYKSTIQPHPTLYWRKRDQQFDRSLRLAFWIRRNSLLLQLFTICLLIIPLRVLFEHINQICCCVFVPYSHLKPSSNSLIVQ